MAIVKISKNKNYTTISNFHLQDSNLSLKAKGLLTLMLSLPENWDYSVKGLEKICIETKNTINNILKELETNGYLTRKMIFNNGKISDWEYTIYEEKQYLKNEDIENEDIKNCDVNKITKEQKVNNYINLTKEQNKKNIIKENFEKFWQSYPKKQNKSKTEIWFKKNKPNEELMNLILEKLELFKKTKEWKKNNGQFIPMPTTWLNGKRWEDEIDEDNIEMTEEEENIMLQEEWERRKKERDNRGN